MTTADEFYALIDSEDPQEMLEKRIPPVKDDEVKCFIPAKKGKPERVHQLFKENFMNILLLLKY